jgi:choline kinase
MARKAIKESFLLLESDLIFDETLLEDMLHPNKIAIARKQPWMNGTCVTINKYRQVKEFLEGDADSSDEIKYKTVNIYSISLNSWRRIVKALDNRISEGKVKGYYETVFGEMVADDSLSFESVSFDDKSWYEIDTYEDLENAEKQFITDRCSTLEATPLERSDSTNLNPSIPYCPPEKQQRP